MAPFQYDRFRDQYSGTIGELMLRQGEIEARRAEMIAAAQARAVETSGQALAGAAQGIGHVVAGTLGEIAKAPQDAMKTQLLGMQLEREKMQMADAQHVAAGRAAFNGALAGQTPSGPDDTTPNGVMAPTASAFLKKEGDGVAVFDLDGITKFMASKGFGDLNPQFVKDVTALNDAHRQEGAIRAQLAQAQQNTVAKGAGTLLGFARKLPAEQLGELLPQLFDATAAQFEANGIDKGQIDKMRASLFADPSQTVAKLEALSRGGNAAPVKGTPGDVFLNPNDLGGEPLAKVAEKPTFHTVRDLGLVQTGAPYTMTPTEKTERVVQLLQSKGLSYTDAGESTRAAAVAEAEREAANGVRVVARSGTPQSGANAQKEEFMLDGKLVLGAFLPDKTGGRRFYRGEDVTARAEAIPGKEPGDGDAAPSLTPDAIRNAAHQYAMTGQLPPMGNGKASAALKSQIMNRAAELYADLDLPSQQAAYKANKDSLVKLQGQADALNSFENTAKKNLQQFLDLSKKVQDTGSPMLNAPLRSFNDNVLGNPDNAAFATARRVIIPEFARIISQPALSGQLSDSARHEIDDILKGNATLAQTLAVAKVLLTDTDNRRTSLDQQIADVSKRIATPPGGKKASSTSAAPITVGGFTVVVKPKS